MDGTLHMNYVKWKSNVHWSAIDTMSVEYLELISTKVCFNMPEYNCTRDF